MKDVLAEKMNGSSRTHRLAFVAYFARAMYCVPGRLVAGPVLRHSMFSSDLQADLYFA